MSEEPIVAVDFPHDAPSGNPFVLCVTDSRYLLPLAEIISSLPCRRYLVIGCLCGTTESYLLQQTDWNPERIVVIDCDHPHYNPERDSGAYVYKNVCAISAGNFSGEFVYCRADSRSSIASTLVSQLGPFDVVFIDGEHTAEAVYADLSLAAGHLSPSGVILVHDITLFGATTPLGFEKWLHDRPEWGHLKISHEQLIHGLGIVWSGSFPLVNIPDAIRCRTVTPVSPAIPTGDCD